MKTQTPIIHFAVHSYLTNFPIHFINLVFCHSNQLIILAVFTTVTVNPVFSLKNEIWNVNVQYKTWNNTILTCTECMLDCTDINTRSLNNMNYRFVIFVQLLLKLNTQSTNQFILNKITTITQQKHREVQQT